MKEFYQTKEFYNAVAVATAVILFLAFFFYGNIFKKKKPKADWHMSSDFISLKALIQCSDTDSHLKHYAEQADEFFNCYFRLEKDNKELINYYSRLLEAISVRKSQMRIPA